MSRSVEPKSQGNAKAVMLPSHTQPGGVHQQEEQQSSLNQQYATFNCQNPQGNAIGLCGGGVNCHDDGDHQQNQAGPAKNDPGKIAQCCKWTEGIIKNFVNYRKPEQRADCRTSPICIKINELVP